MPSKSPRCGRFIAIFEKHTIFVTIVHESFLPDNFDDMGPYYLVLLNYKTKLNISRKKMRKMIVLVSTKIKENDKSDYESMIESHVLFCIRTLCL